jgi:hypothetical protein
VQRTTCQPAALKAWSRSRSLSNAEAVSWVSLLSVSTIKPASRQRKSGLTGLFPTMSLQLTSGGGSFPTSHIAKKRRSSQLRLLPVCGLSSAISRRRRATPRRPGFRPIVDSTASRFRIRRTSASDTVLFKSEMCVMPARSSSMRATVVHGMPRTEVRSAGRREPSRWALIPAGMRPRRCGAVTSNGQPGSARNRHRAAAEPCERTALGPHASTAAIFPPSRLSGRCPTE